MRIVIVDDIIRELDNKMDYLSYLDSCDEYPYEIISIGQKYKETIIDPIVSVTKSSGNVFDDLICHELTESEMIKWRLSPSDIYYGVYDQEAIGIAVRYTQPLILYELKTENISSYMTVKNFKNVIKYSINALREQERRK